jgi:hypothetical protein
MTTDTSTSTSAGGTASTAVDQGRQVAGTAKEEAANVAGTAADQARTVVGDARRQVTGQVTEQAAVQRDKLSETLRTLGDDLEQMAAGQGPGSGLAADLVREVSDRARTISSRIEGREPGQLLDDARDFARRRPGTFLVGALAAGVVAGRLFRATADGAAAASLATSADGPTTGARTDDPVVPGVAPATAPPASPVPPPSPVVPDAGVTPATTSMPGRPTLETP